MPETCPSEVVLLAWKMFPPSQSLLFLEFYKFGIANQLNPNEWSHYVCLSIAICIEWLQVNECKESSRKSTKLIRQISMFSFHFNSVNTVAPSVNQQLLFRGPWRVRKETPKRY